MKGIDLDPSAIPWLLGVVAANLGSFFMGYVSIRVKIAKLEVKVDTLRRDVNSIGSMFRKLQEKREEK
ncbi:MAG: hypothetical protein KGL39_33170 [Patescibacteria group bacterium]|nr:hypothetical protein [Patescibacteria group bacterium]